MIVELITLIIILMVPALVIYKYSKGGVLGELSTRFSMENSEGIEKLKWTPFIVEQYGRNKVFLSNAKLGVSSQGLFIRYIFPFSLIMKGLYIPVSQIIFAGFKRVHGLLYRIIKIKGIESGCLLFPELYLNKDKKLVFDQVADQEDGIGE